MIVKDTSIWVPFPDIDGFEVNVRYIAREELMKIRSSSLVAKLNKTTRQREETVDSSRFLELYAEQAIIGWKGLKVKHLPMLLPVDISAMNKEEEVAFTQDDAVELLKSSSIFDQFITDSINDYEAFSKTKAEATVKN